MSPDTPGPGLEADEKDVEDAAPPGERPGAAQLRRGRRQPDRAGGRAGEASPPRPGDRDALGPARHLFGPDRRPARDRPADAPRPDAPRERLRARIRGPSRRARPSPGIQPARPDPARPRPGTTGRRGGPPGARPRGQRRRQADGDDRVPDDRRLAERPARCPPGPDGPVAHGLAGRPPLLSASFAARDGPSVYQRGRDGLRGRRARRHRAAPDDPAGRRRIARARWAARSRASRSSPRSPSTRC